MPLRHLIILFLIFFQFHPISYAANDSDSADVSLDDCAPSLMPFHYYNSDNLQNDSSMSPNDLQANKDFRLKSAPTTPFIQKPKTPGQPLGCKRLFSLGNKLFVIDSYNYQDAERLRPFIESVPEALEELNQYQKNRRAVKMSAYAGTAGLILFLGSAILSNEFSGSTQKTIRTLGLISGLGVGLGFTAYSLITLRTNESHLEKAVNYYNQKNPEKAITLHFSTGALF